MPNAVLKTVNGIKQITTHFGTFTENDSDYYLYDNDELEYRVYNELEGYTYYYNLDGEMTGISNENAVNQGGFN